MNCAICLNNVKKHGYRKCKNGHKYHRSCIGTWLTRSDSCPQCRVPMRTKKDLENISKLNKILEEEDEEYVQQLNIYQTNMNILEDVFEGNHENYRISFSDVSDTRYDAIILRNVVRRLLINGIPITVGTHSLFNSAINIANMNSYIHFEELH